MQLLPIRVSSIEFVAGMTAAKFLSLGCFDFHRNN